MRLACAKSLALMRVSRWEVGQPVNPVRHRAIFTLNRLSCVNIISVYLSFAPAELRLHCNTFPPCCSVPARGTWRVASQQSPFLSALKFLYQSESCQSYGLRACPCHLGCRYGAVSPFLYGLSRPAPFLLVVCCRTGLRVEGQPDGQSPPIFRPR